MRIAKPKTRKVVKKVVKGLKKASKTHASQAKSLSALKLSKGGSTVNAAGNYTKPTMRKNIFNRIKVWGPGPSGPPGPWALLGLGFGFRVPLGGWLSKTGALRVRVWI